MPDMRDGARLCRLFDEAPQPEGEPRGRLSTLKLRLPASTRNNKIHNVGHALSGMCNSGSRFLSSDAVSKHTRLIIDKNEEALRDVLWAFATEAVMPLLAPVAAVREETARLRRMAPASLPEVESDADPCSAQLLQWIVAVGAEQRVTVRDLGRSLKDGKALCAVLDHYMPSLLQSGEAAAEGKEGKRGKAADADSERMRRFAEGVASLGCVPALLGPADASPYGPDERVAALALSYLFARCAAGPHARMRARSPLL
jgi:hypothetical protein